jgi:hypothetical protein
VPPIIHQLDRLAVKRTCTSELSSGEGLLAEPTLSVAAGGETGEGATSDWVGPDAGSVRELRVLC